MKRHFRIGLINLFILAMMIGFNNCQQVNFKDSKIRSGSGAPSDGTLGGYDDGGSGGADTGAGSPDGSTGGGGFEEIQADTGGGTDNGTVQNLCSTLPRQAEPGTITFLNPGGINWNNEGNLDDNVEQSFQGRNTQTFDFSLPDEAIICGIDFQFEDQRFKYDDVFVLTFNDYILASSYDFEEGLFESRDGLEIFDWSELVGTVWHGQPHPRNGIFCANSPTTLCSWPETEESGQIEMQFDDSLFQKIMGFDVNRNTHSFKLIVTGDNDPNIDGRHDDISFDVSISYVLP